MCLSGSSRMDRIFKVLVVVLASGGFFFYVREAADFCLCAEISMKERKRRFGFIRLFILKQATGRTNSLLTGRNPEQDQA